MPQEKKRRLSLREKRAFVLAAKQKYCDEYDLIRIVENGGPGGYVEPDAPGQWVQAMVYVHAVEADEQLKAPELDYDENDPKLWVTGTGEAMPMSAMQDEHMANILCGPIAYKIKKYNPERLKHLIAEAKRRAEDLARLGADVEAALGLDPLQEAANE